MGKHSLDLTELSLCSIFFIESLNKVARELFVQSPHCNTVDVSQNHSTEGQVSSVISVYIIVLKGLEQSEIWRAAGCPKANSTNSEGCFCYSSTHWLAHTALWDNTGLRHRGMSLSLVVHYLFCFHSHTWAWLEACSELWRGPPASLGHRALR